MAPGWGPRCETRNLRPAVVWEGRRGDGKQSLVFLEGGRAGGQARGACCRARALSTVLPVNGHGTLTASRKRITVAVGKNLVEAHHHGAQLEPGAGAGARRGAATRVPALPAVRFPPPPPVFREAVRPEISRAALDVCAARDERT